MRYIASKLRHRMHQSGFPEEIARHYCSNVSRERIERAMQGLCPACGVAGSLDAFGGARCPTHGTYQMLVAPPTGGCDPEDFRALDGTDEYEPEDCGATLPPPQSGQSSGPPGTFHKGQKVIARRPMTQDERDRPPKWVDAMDYIDGKEGQVTGTSSLGYVGVDFPCSRNWLFLPTWLEVA